MKIAIEGEPAEIAGILNGAPDMAPAIRDATGMLDTCSLAKLLGITPRRVQQLAKDGIFRRRTDESGRAIYDAADSIKSYCAHIRATAERKDAKHLRSTVKEMAPELGEVIAVAIEKLLGPQS